jgi:hypothetical protein
MRLDSADRLLREQVEVVSFRFLYAEAYFRAATGHNETFWKFSQNCYGEVAILLWCHLFNSYNKDPVHYKNLFGGDKLVPLSKLFATSAVRARLLTAASLDEVSYADYREAVKVFRDKYVAHREYLQGAVTFPDLKIAASMIRELRVILEETVVEELRVNPGDPELEELAVYYEDHQNDALVLRCNRDAEHAIAKSEI